MSQRRDEGPLKIGARFLERYEIQGLLGHGGQAWVYRAQHTFTGREVAIKIIHSPYGVTNEMLVRAKAEARALGRLDHENIVIMHDAGVTDEGKIYILMELLRGCSLRRVLAQHGQLEVEETLRLLIQAGKAVQAAHAERMIHRDLKPDNLFVIHGNAPGGGNRLKVLDFGIAKMLDEIGFTTKKDVVVGTVLYMSPEQAKGLSVTEQSDIYALGLIMFEAFIGKHPCVLMFEQGLIERGEPDRRPGIADIPPIQVNNIPPLLTELRRDIPLYVAHLVQRAIAKIAEQRFSTVGNFVSAMETCLERYLRDVPLSVRRPSGRDLSLLAPGPSEMPVSQRATAKQSVSLSPAAHALSVPTAERPALPIGLLNTEVMQPVPSAGERDAAPTSSAPVVIQTSRIGTNLAARQSPVAPKPEPATVAPKSGQQRERTSSEPVPVAPAPQAIQPASKKKPPPSGPFKPATPPPVTVTQGRNVGNDIARSNRAVARNALLLGGVFGAVLSTAAMLHFHPTSQAASRSSAGWSADTLVSMSSNPPAAAAPQPALPAPLPREPQQVAAPEVALAAPGTLDAAQPTPSTTPIARVKPTVARTASTKPVDKMDQRLLQLESDLGSDRTKSPHPSASTTPHKVAPRAIYGD